MSETPRLNKNVLRNTTDAKIWAQEFMKVIDSGVTVDEGLMIGWFAGLWAVTHDKDQTELTTAKERIREMEGLLSEIKKDVGDFTFNHPFFADRDGYARYEVSAEEGNKLYSVVQRIDAAMKPNAQEH